MYKEHPINSTVAAKHAQYAMMSSNCYIDNPSFDMEAMGWTRRRGNGQRTTYLGKYSGLAYDVYDHTDGRVALAFCGTDSLWDWLIANAAIAFGIPQKSAYKHYCQLIEQGANIKIVTGHSLGGGIALGISFRFGVEAVVFDTSPRIFDGLGNKHRQARRTHIYQKGDPLNVARCLWPKFRSVRNSIETWVTDFDFEGKGAHSCYPLAKGLENLGK